MMSTLRDKRTMKIILGFVIVAFVATIFLAWGMKFQKNPRINADLLAKVGSEEITYSDFQKAYQPQLDQLYAIRKASPGLDETTALKQRVLDTMIDNSILKQTAKKLRITVTDEEVAAILQREPYFADETGKFSRTKYLQVLQANQLTPEIFEAAQHSDLLMQKIRGILMDSVLYNGDGLDDFRTLLSRRLKADYIQLDPKNYEKDLQIAESDLRDYYEANRSKFDHPERVKVRHILIPAAGPESGSSKDKAEKTLNEYRDQVLSGKATFASLAKKYSQDPGSRNKGGDLGWVTRGIMIKEFEDTVFSMKKGDVSRPFQTKFGYHIAQVEATEKEYKSTFNGVRAQVLSDYKKEKVQQRVYDIVAQLSVRIRKKESIEKAADDLKLVRSSTTWFGRDKDIPGIRDSKMLVNQLGNLYPGDWAGPFPLNDKEYFFQVTEAQDGTGKTIETKTADLARIFLQYRQNGWLKDFLAEERKKAVIKTDLNG
jgi:peptidyl-prolyl cis-trans isomerase D